MAYILNHPLAELSSINLLGYIDIPEDMMPTVVAHYYHQTDSAPRPFGLKTALVKCDDSGWITDKTLAEFVAEFPVSRTFEAPIPEWFMADQQGRELRRAVNQIAMDSRRGCTSTIYCGKDFTEEHPTYHGPLFKKNYVDFVPEGYVFLLYENDKNFLDSAFVYDPKRGIMPNLRHHGYGRLVRIINSSAPRLPQDPISNADTTNAPDAPSYPSGWDNGVSGRPALGAAQ